MLPRLWSQTTVDYTSCNGLVLAASLLLVAFAVGNLAVPGILTETIYATVGGFIFSLFMIHDVQVRRRRAHGDMHSRMRSCTFPNACAWRYASPYMRAPRDLRRLRIPQ